MALIKCPNCQKDVSSMVNYCPFCNADLTHIKNSAAQNDSLYYNPNAGYSSPRPENRPNPDNSQESFLHDPDIDEYSRDFSEYDTAPNPPRQNHPSGDSGQTPASVSSRQNHSGSRQQKSKRQASYGRRLLGYRAGNPLYMLISIFYHMAACVGVLYALSLTPQYTEGKLLIFHLCRVILAAIMLFLPVLLLTNNKLRRSLPLFSSKKKTRIAAGFLILYIPLIVLFIVSWYFCL